MLETNSELRRQTRQMHLSRPCILMDAAKFMVCSSSLIMIINVMDLNHMHIGNQLAHCIFIGYFYSETYKIFPSPIII